LRATNATGTARVFDAAAAGKTRVVFFSTVAAFRCDVTFTELSEIGTSGSDPYRQTKREALRDAQARIERPAASSAPVTWRDARTPPDDQPSPAIAFGRPPGLV
jgi:nucleoside-diphosphate-sugar epimerase